MPRLIISLMNTIMIVLLSLVKVFSMDNKINDVLLFDVEPNGNLTEIIISESDIVYSSDLEIFSSRYASETSEIDSENIIIVKGDGTNTLSINTKSPVNEESTIPVKNKNDTENHMEKNSASPPSFKYSMYESSSPQESNIEYANIQPGWRPYINLKFKNKHGSKLQVNTDRDDFNNTNNHMTQSFNNFHDNEDEISGSQISSGSDENLLKTKLKKRRKHKIHIKEDEETFGNVSEFISILIFVVSLPVIVLLCWGIYEYIMSKKKI